MQRNMKTEGCIESCKQRRQTSSIFQRLVLLLQNVENGFKRFCFEEVESKGFNKMYVTTYPDVLQSP